MSTFGTVAIVGPGLIGGSIGLGLKQGKLAQRVIGVVRSDASGRRATGCGVVDSVSTDLAQGVSEADLVVVCTPVGQVATTVAAAAKACRPGTPITDVGSTKARLVVEIEQGNSTDGPPIHFVGSHPLAGNHRSGPESARADLLAGRTVIVTPTPRTDAEALERVTHFWSGLGARVVRMSPAEHDAAVALTSHVPHLVASAMAAATPEALLEFVGGGWRDTTRVASGSATLWRDILLDNREEVLACLTQFESQLARLRRSISDADAQAVQQVLEEGKLRRDALGS
jgi:prephenate dehydrogenase